MNINYGFTDFFNIKRGKLKIESTCNTESIFFYQIH